MPPDIFQTKNLKKLNANLNKMGQLLIYESSKRIKTEVGTILLSEAIEARNDILKSIQQTPRRMDIFYSRQQGKKKHHPSKPDSPPAIDTGNMIKSIVFDSYDYKFIVGSIQTDPPYPEWLENPPVKAKYKKRPWLEPVIENREKEIINNLEKIIPNITSKIFREKR